MIEIPGTTSRFSQPNSSDLLGNVYYTKNINFDLEGYIGLSPRSIAFINKDVDTDFGIPVSIGRNNSFNVQTTDQNFVANISNQSSSVTQDAGTGNPGGSFFGYGKFWQNQWHVTNSTGLYYKSSSTGNWTNTGVTLTASIPHPMAVFQNLNRLAIGDGNTVDTYSTSYGASVQTLTLPSEFEVSGLAYNNTKLGVVTKLSDTAENQNNEAFFFIWDGATSQANQGYGTGSDYVISIVPYKSSFAILTRQGQLRYFNGGGFEDIGQFPVYFENKVWGDPVNALMYGDCLVVDGDVIYMLINADIANYGKKNQDKLQNMPSGVWCYDPKVGVYHKYSPSISLQTFLTVTTANINSSTDTMTTTTGTVPDTGNPVKMLYSVSDPIVGLEPGSVYYIIKVSPTEFRVATTRENALNGIAIPITANSSNPSYFLALTLVDYSQTYTGRLGGLANSNLETLNASFFFGGELFDDSVTTLNTLCGLVKEFDNIGYFVTPKIIANGQEDIIQNFFVSYRPLKASDSIIVKHRERELTNIPVSTPTATNTSVCYWTADNEFTTISNISEVYNYFTSGGDVEVEVVSGCGGGQMVQVSNIVESSGTYTVTLEDSLLGITVGQGSNVFFDNWKTIGTITSADQDEFKKIPVGLSSNWHQFKVIMKGSDVAIRKIKIDNVSNAKI